MRVAFTGEVAAALLCYKRYPTKEDYLNVSRAIIRKYPFMGAPVGSPTDTLTHIPHIHIGSLSCEFAKWEFRRDKEKSERSSTPKTTPEKPQSPGKNISLVTPQISHVKMVYCLLGIHREKSMQIWSNGITIEFCIQKDD